MEARPQPLKPALVLPGGGARGAFQVGVLKAIAELVPVASPSPFRILSGTSAGAINSVVLATRARRFRVAVGALEHVWANFHCDQVYRCDALTMLKSSLHWLIALVLGGTLVGTPRSLLDNAPLKALLSRKLRFPRIEQAIECGWLEAVAITAAGYATARSTSFFQATPEHEPWARTRREGRPDELHLDHLMASIAVPMIFPPVKIRQEYFGDGAMRQATPLSPAVHLGADRILVIGVRDETAASDVAPGEEEAFPSFAQIAGYMLDTLFLDGLYSDLERLTRINEMIDAVPPEDRSGALADVRPIDTMIIVPSEDLREIAYEHRKSMPFAVRSLLGGIGGGDNDNGSRLLSFLLFESDYTKRLIELGYRDAMAHREELSAFVNGGEIPRLFAPSWVTSDLTGTFRKLVLTTG